MRMLSPISTDWSWPRRNLSPGRMEDMFDDFDYVVDSLLRPSLATTAKSFQPSCDVSETKDHYLVSFDIPGVKKEDIKIEIKGNELMISGERQREVKKENGEALHHERMYGRFERTFAMPATIAVDKIEAHFENGVLNVALPKAEAAKSRTIQIQTDQGGLLNKFLGSKKETNTEMKDVKII